MENIIKSMMQKEKAITVPIERSIPESLQGETWSQDIATQREKQHSHLQQVETYLSSLHQMVSHKRQDIHTFSGQYETLVSEIQHLKNTLEQVELQEESDRQKV